MLRQEQRRKKLIAYLLNESGRTDAIPQTADAQKRLLRALCNVRMPKAASAEFLRLQDEYLQEEIRRKGITDLNDLPPIAPGLYLWKGDITTLRCDGIVNAANAQMLGCFCPNHGCIDNAIHTFAGVQLRAACAERMRSRPFLPTGEAEITPAFNLPCRYVLHTVGPIVGGALTAAHERELADCYRSCLKLAERNGLKSLAFCCISTGEFRFPDARAAAIAVQTVTEYRRQTGSAIQVIFDVFRERDYERYKQLLTTD